MSDKTESPISFEERSFAPAQVAEALGVCRVQVHRLIASGKLKSFKVGRARRCTGRQINDYRQAGES